MAKITSALLTVCITLPLFSQATGDSAIVPVIPQPRQVERMDGAFAVGKDVSIICDRKLNGVAAMFNERLSNTAGFAFPVQTRGRAKGNITLKITPKLTEKEGYRLAVNPSDILIEASHAEGIFYGLQTLHQLILNAKDARIPCCRITDAPRFAWRGVMLDVSRTFMPITLIKRYIDLFAEYKLNVLHLHLTDDQGWRVEIKKYPRLTQVGSKFAPEFNAMGGYYTQDDIRDLVRYAGLRNMTLVPEIDMPGHVVSALAAHPELSCTGEAPKIHTFFDGPNIHEAIFCAGKETTYEFVFNVLDEVMALFPSTYIHIGGDEVKKANWKKCPLCQRKMADEGLKNEEELQSYFVNRVGAHLQKNGRTLIGWDEIWEGGKLTGNEVLMFWRSGKVGGKIGDMLESGFKIVCTPVPYCYFDHPYDDKTFDKPSSFFLSIDTRKIYGYEPVIAGTPEAGYIGVQASFWSHVDKSENRIDKQLFPRVLGLAETAWSLPSRKDWEHFKHTARKAIVRLKEIDDVNVYLDTSLQE